MLTFKSREGITYEPAGALELSREEILERIGRGARRRLHMSAEEFIKAYRSGQPQRLRECRRSIDACATPQPGRPTVCRRLIFLRSWVKRGPLSRSTNPVDTPKLLTSFGTLSNYSCLTLSLAAVEPFA